MLPRESPLSPFTIRAIDGDSRARLSYFLRAAPFVTLVTQSPTDGAAFRTSWRCRRQFPVRFAPLAIYPTRSPQKRPASRSDVAWVSSATGHFEIRSLDVVLRSRGLSHGQKLRATPRTACATDFRLKGGRRCQGMRPTERTVRGSSFARWGHMPISRRMKRRSRGRPATLRFGTLSAQWPHGLQLDS